METKRRVAAALYPRPIELVDMVNEHASLVQWLKGQKAPRFPHRFDLYAHVAKMLGDVPINYLEFGVHKGESFQRWLGLNSNADSSFVGFDTFTGLPTDWGKYLERGHFDVGGETPQVDDKRASFRKGLFQETLDPFLETFKNDKQLVIHNDSDLKSSTHFTLARLDPFIKPGTIIIFDEFASPLHEYRAWNDYLDAFMRKAEFLGYTDEFATQAAFRFEQ